MNKKRFIQFMYQEFPTVFEDNFTREMMNNILDYAKDMEEVEQYDFLCSMIPEITERELGNLFL